jgi:hypothetical protein
MPGEEPASDSGKNENGRSSQNAKNNKSGSSPGANRSSAISTSRNRPAVSPALPPRPAAAPKAEELRVALQELGSGDTSGRVFVRLPSATAAATARAAGGTHRCSGVGLSGSPAPAAAALLTDREAARARVSRQLRELVEEDFAPPGKQQ